MWYSYLFCSDLIHNHLTLLIGICNVSKCCLHRIGYANNMQPTAAAAAAVTFIII